MPLWLVAVIVVLVWQHGRNASQNASTFAYGQGFRAGEGASLAVVTPGIAGELGAPHVSAATGLPSFEIPEIDWRRFN